MWIRLDLSEEEIVLLRNQVSLLGTENKNCVSLQLKIANAILDGKNERIYLKEVKDSNNVF